MADIVDLVSPLLADVPTAPEPTLVQAYRDAARRFFFRTRAWRGEVTISKESDGVYTVDGIPPDTEVFDATYADYGDGNQLTKMTTTQMLARWSKPGTPEAFRINADGKIQVTPTNGIDISGTGRMVAIFRPTRTADVLDDNQADLHDERLRWGALSILLSKPNRAWTSPELAGYYGSLFRDETDEWQSHGANEGMRGVRRRVRYGGIN